MPKISVVVPIYNVETYLDQCVHSLLAQTYPDIEVILVDDGSPDRCPTMCDMYADHDKRVRVVHQLNRGVSVARNVGMDMATGEWLMFCDPDDWYELSAVEIMVAHAERFNSDIAVFGHILHYFDHVKQYPAIAEDKLLTERDKIYAYKDQLNFVITSVNKLYRRCVIESQHIRFSSGITNTEELLFSMNMLSATNRISYSAVCLYHCLIRENSASRRYRQDIFMQYAKILQELRTFTNKSFDAKLGNEIYLAQGAGLLTGGMHLYCLESETPLTLCQRLHNMRNVLSVEPWRTIVRQNRHELPVKRRIALLLLRQHWFLLYYILKKF